MSLVTDGVYRFQNTSAGDFSYLTLASSGQVKGASLDVGSDTQKWKVTKRSENLYDITSVSNGATLKIAAPSGGETAYTLTTNGSESVSWDLDIKGAIVTIKATGLQHSKEVVDLSVGNRVILWQGYGGQNQSWVAEAVASEVVVPRPAVKWVTITDGTLPGTPVEGGHRGDGSQIHVARAYMPSVRGYVPGKAWSYVDSGKPAITCWIPFAGREIPLTNSGFDVLIGEPGTYKWLTYPGGKLDLNKLATLAAGHGISGKPVEGCTTPDYGPMFPMRAMFSDELTPGKAGPGASFDRPQYAEGGCAMLGWNGTEHDISASYDVLCYAP